jgi:hypothetical protein
MVPLRLVANKDSEEVILYDNERPNNPHSSRPVQLAFDNDNSASIQAENQLLKQEINSLEKFFLSEDPKIDIEFKGLMTMVDGKVVSALTNQNTCRCNICDKSSPEMVKNEGPFPSVSEERLQFGILPLYFGLRVFEALLHIAYKQDVKDFKVRNSKDKATVAERTAAVKSAFEQELGLKVDHKGRVCGVSTMPVTNFDVIWHTLASSQPINSEKIGELWKKTLSST